MSKIYPGVESSQQQSDEDSFDLNDGSTRSGRCDEVALKSVLDVVRSRPNPGNRISCPRCGNVKCDSMVDVRNPANPDCPPQLVCKGDQCCDHILKTVECNNYIDPKLRLLTRDNMCDLQPGDQIAWHRGICACFDCNVPTIFHHAIVNGVNCDNETVDVIEWTVDAPASSSCCCKPQIIIETKNKPMFNFNDDTYVIDYVESFPADYVLERVRSRMDPEVQKKNRYCFLTKNCESLSRWAKTGRAESDQAQNCIKTFSISFFGFILRLLSASLLLLIEALAHKKDTPSEVDGINAWLSLGFAIVAALTTIVSTAAATCSSYRGTVLEYDAGTCWRRFWRRDCCAINCGLLMSIVSELVLTWFAPLGLIALMQFLYPGRTDFIKWLIGVLVAAYIVGYFVGRGVGRCLQQSFDCMCRCRSCKKRRSQSHLV